MDTCMDEDILQNTRRKGKDGVQFAKNWRIILYNDDTTNELFILDDILCGIFKYEIKDAFRLMKTIEATGQQVIAVLPKKLAEVRIKHSRQRAADANYKDFKIEMKEED